jgi:hypothetical protein
MKMDDVEMSDNARKLMSVLIEITASSFGCPPEAMLEHWERGFIKFVAGADGVNAFPCEPYEAPQTKATIQ